MRLNEVIHIVLGTMPSMQATMDRSQLLGAVQLLWLVTILEAIKKKKWYSAEGMGKGITYEYCLGKDCWPSGQGLTEQYFPQ